MLDLRRKTVIKVGAVVLVVGAVVAGFRGGLWRRGAASAAAPDLAWHLTQGQLYDYDLTYDVDGKTNVAALVAAGADALRRGAVDSAAWQPVATHVRATLRLLPAGPEATDGSLELIVQLRDLQALTTQDSRRTDGIPPAGATVTSRVTLFADGRLEKLLFADGESPYVRSLVRSVLSLVQVRFGSGGAEWEAAEEAPSGRYLAHYAISDRSGGAVLLRKRLADPVAAPAKGRTAVFAGANGRHVAGELRVRFAADAGRVAAVEGQRETQMLLGDIPVGQELARVALTFKNTASAPADLPQVAAARGAPASDLLGTDELARLARAQLEKTLGGASLEEILGAVEAPGATKLRDLQRAHQQLIAFLKLHPERSLEAARDLARLDTSSLAFEDLAMALTAAGTSEAQAALATVLSDVLASDPERAQLLIPHLSMGELPSEATEALLRELVTSGPTPAVRHTAELALGTVAHQLLATEPTRAERLVGALGASLAGAGDDRQRSLELSALGNIGHPRQTALIQPYLDHGDAELRERAVNALRFVDTDEAKSVLAAKARTDASDTVRARAVEALSFTEPAADALELYRGILRQERSVAVVREAARNLYLMSREQPAALAELKGFEQRCANPDLCPYVAGLIRSAEAGGRG